MDQKTCDVLFAMLRSVICGVIPVSFEKGALGDELLAELYAVADKHDIAQLIGHALYQNGLIDKTSACHKQFQRAQLKAVYRYEQMSRELKKICEALENAEIAYMPLKGSVIRAYYPEPWLRTSCDIDVLVHEENLDRAVRALMECGWTVKGKKGYHDISLYSAGGTHLELHYNIKENRESIDRLLEKVWKYADLTDGHRFEYRQRNEYLLFHLLAHMSYHFVTGGCGVRTFMDIWILRKVMPYDEAKLKELCNAAKLSVFYEAVKELISVWFEEREHTALTKQMEDYVIGGGVYGSMVNRVVVNQAQTGSKLKNLRNRIFMPYEQLKIMYPVLERCRCFCPVFEVVRWVQILVSGRMKRAMNELSLNQKSTGEQIQEAGEFLQKLGLDVR